MTRTDEYAPRPLVENKEKRKNIGSFTDDTEMKGRGAPA
jgi:hypothetical protein